MDAAQTGGPEAGAKRRLNGQDGDGGGDGFMTLEGGGAAAAGGGAEAEADRSVKLARLGDDRLARLPAGGNLVEFEGKSCTHEVAWPPGQEGSLLPPTAKEGPPAREYPFRIDPFQQSAINALEAGARARMGAWRMGEGWSPDCASA
jgi:superfamily II RNA helicase